jgi:hypothetical protein
MPVRAIARQQYIPDPCSDVITIYGAVLGMIYRRTVITVTVVGLMQV